MLALDLRQQREALDKIVAGQTLCSRFAATVGKCGDLRAQCWLVEGEWRSRTWRELKDVVQKVTVGLHRLGIRRGSFGVILGPNCPEHVIADLAMVHAGITPVSLYPTMSAEQIRYIMNHSGAELVIASDAAALRRFQDLAPDLPCLRHLIVWDGVAAGAHAWADLLELGSEPGDASLFGDLAGRVRPEDVLQLVYTSGTTGPPKAVILTHQMILWQISANQYEIELQPGERLLSYLPMAHLAERSHIYYPGVLAGCTTYYWSDIDTMIQGLQAARPGYLMGTPRIFEKLMSRLRVAIEADPELTRAFRIGVQAELRRQRREPGADPDAEAAASMVLRRVLELAGLDRCRVAIVSGAPAGEDLFSFFRGLGLMLGTIYGQTESGGGVTSVISGYTAGSAGTPLPGMEVRIAAGGEILIRGHSTTPGYYKDPQATSVLRAEDGWLHTGDVGKIRADESLRITGRIKDIIITSGGKNVTPSVLEGLIREIPLVDQVCVVGERRHYLTAVVTVDPAAVGAWAAERGLPSAALPDLLTRSDLALQLAEQIAARNAFVSRAEQVKRFIVTADEWTVRTGKLTPSFKLRRLAITEAYEQQIDAMYDELAGIPVPGPRTAGTADAAS
jgi:long-subunit acyl-CoA synthetase (AMP-forming)